MASSVLLTDLYELTMLQAYFSRADERPTRYSSSSCASPAAVTAISCSPPDSSRSSTSCRIFASRRRSRLARIESGRFTPAFLESLADSALHRRRRRDARGHRVLRRRADPAHRRAVARGAARREPGDEPPPLPDRGRKQGRALGARRARPPAGRFRPPARARRRSGAAVGARELSRRFRRNRDGRSRPRSSAFRCSARWPTPTCRRTPTKRRPSIASRGRIPKTPMLLIDTYDTERAAQQVVALASRLADGGASRSRGCASTAAISAITRGACAPFSTPAALPRITIFASGNLDEHRLRRPGRAGRADRRLRHRHADEHVGRCALPRLRVQAAGIRRVDRGASVPRARRHGRGASRSGVTLPPTVRSGETRCVSPTRPAVGRRCSPR